MGLVKKVTGNLRIFILLVFVLLSLVLIAPNPNPVGVKIAYIGKNSSVEELVAGDFIYKIKHKHYHVGY